jgi:putative nucleotidyltransferase with HDIG domain
LVVDDDESLRELLYRALQVNGYDCYKCRDGLEALEFIAANPVDIVVTDIQMPRMDGIELCEKVSGQAHVIVITGSASDVMYEEIIAHGASDFIEKPIRLGEFLARLKRVVNERETLAAKDQAALRLKEGLTKLRQTMDATVQCMSVAIEMRDPYTAGHQRRVADIACAIAREMGFEEEEVYGLRVAASMHDLGKIAIPAEILTKPGELSDLEQQVVRTHVTSGYEIIKNLDFQWPIAEVVLQHHERMDGSGYPKGLRGEEIKLEARIVAVADVLETMATHRPYRAAKGQPAALAEITGNRGTLFDSRVVDACVSLDAKKRLFPKSA